MPKHKVFDIDMNRNERNFLRLTLFSFLGSVLMFCFSRCKEEKSLSISVHSDTIASREERLSILRPYLGHHEGIEDASYSLTFHDNSTGMVPGPSDYHMVIALKLHPDSINYWVSTNVLMPDNIDLSPWRRLHVIDSGRWSLHGEPEVVTWGENKKIFYRQSGILLIEFQKY